MASQQLMGASHRVGSTFLGVGLPAWQGVKGRALRAVVKNNGAGLRRDLVHLKGALKAAYRDMRPSMQHSRWAKDT
jgi:hypothetical protein